MLVFFRPCLQTCRPCLQLQMGSQVQPNFVSGVAVTQDGAFPQRAETTAWPGQAPLSCFKSVFSLVRFGLRIVKILGFPLILVKISLYVLLRFRTHPTGK